MELAGRGRRSAIVRAGTRSPGTEYARPRVEFIGWQATDQLRKEYADSNLFLFPSRHEGMPNAVLEAMASGLPVIATRIAGNEELVVDGQTGILVPVEDAAALREALRESAGRR